MRLQEIMTTDIATCMPDTPLEEVASIMDEYDCGMVPIVAGDGTTRPVGTVTDRDITIRTVAKGENPLDYMAGDVMTANPITIHHHSSHEEAMELMESHQLRRLLAIDDNGECIGVISQADLARNADESAIGEVVQHVSQPSSPAARL